MKGLDALAKACEPVADPAAAPAATLPLTDDQIDRRASVMIEKLQNQRPETNAEKDDTAPDQEDQADQSGEEEAEDET